jgi:hypothetical protein
MPSPDRHPQCRSHRPRGGDTTQQDDPIIDLAKEVVKRLEFVKRSGA